MVLSSVFVFMIGTVIGSFLNVCIYRLPKDKSIVNPPSHCPACGKNIPWHDNIPVLSFLLLGGRCRFCKAKISFRYFLVEVLTAFLTLSLFLAFGLSAKFFAYLILTSALLVATFVDFEIQAIPDEVTYTGLVLGMAMAFIFPSVLGGATRWHALMGSFLGILTGALSIYILRAAGTLLFKKKLEAIGEKHAMGSGDIYLLAMVGAFLGWKLTLLAFFIAPFLGSIVGIILKLKKGADIIPYGPYLSLAAIISIFWGNKILGLFLRIY
ncbi:MAG: prepilin peptidase [Candidatus Omnitrophica bacterium]|nr:prepilin peptidase [Candidatus Omnitrophota bacterium]